MDNPKCETCGSTMKRNGRTSAGAQRWRRRACGASSTHRADNAAKQLKAFLAWLFGKNAISEAATYSKATFERRAAVLKALAPSALHRRGLRRRICRRCLHHKKARGAHRLH